MKNNLKYMWWAGVIPLKTNIFEFRFRNLEKYSIGKWILDDIDIYLYMILLYYYITGIC